MHARVRACKDVFYRPGPCRDAGTGSVTDPCRRCRWSRHRNSRKHSRSRSAVNRTKALTLWLSSRCPHGSRLQSHLLLPQVPHPTNECQVEADSETVLEEKRCSTAVQLPSGDDGDAVAQKVSFIHVMSGENHCPTCTRVQQTLSRLQAYFISSSCGGGGCNSTQECSFTRSPALYFSSRSQMDLLEYGSTPDVGSSKMTTFDPPTNAMATDSFLCIPPVGRIRGKRTD